MALAGERSEPVRLVVRDHHACSVQATSRVQSDAGDGIIFFATSRVRIRPAGHIEPPRRHAAPTSVPATPAENPCRSCISSTPQLEREQSLVRRFGHIARTSRGNTGGFRSQRIPQFESYHPSHAVGLRDVQERRAYSAPRGLSDNGNPHRQGGRLRAGTPQFARKSAIGLARCP